MLGRFRDSPIGSSGPSRGAIYAEGGARNGSPMPRVSFSTQCWGQFYIVDGGVEGGGLPSTIASHTQLKTVIVRVHAGENKRGIALHRTNIPFNICHPSTLLSQQSPSPYPLSKPIRPDQTRPGPSSPSSVQSTLGSSGQALPQRVPTPQKASLTEPPRPTIVPLFATGTAQAPCGFSPACRHAKDIRDTFCRHPITTTTRGRRRRHGPRPVPVSESDTGPAVCCFLQPFPAWPSDSPLCCRLLHLSSSTTRHRHQAPQSDSMSKVCIYKWIITVFGRSSSRSMTDLPALYLDVVV